MATGPHTRAIAWLYRNALKPLLFQVDPEDVHDQFLNIGAILGATTVGQTLTRIFFAYEHQMLHTTITGIRFKNPIGLAAGFDKNARLYDIMPDVGFGFTELGSFTGKPCVGNPRPRLWRIPSLRALRVYYGLANPGADAVSAQLRGVAFRIPIGISAARTNDQATVEPEAGIADYVHVVERFRGIGRYLTLNISCPNTFCTDTFTEPALLERLLSALDPVVDKPMFVKLAPDLAPSQLDAILESCQRHRVSGFICSNLTKQDASADLPGQGGISGYPAQQSSDAQIAAVYAKTQGRYPIIGVGGIFSAEDAYRKIRRGASLVQLITGMIYEGPQLIGQMNRDLVQLLKRDGFASVSQAVGADSR
jgi:dihydroorotate dehydrogenase